MNRSGLRPNGFYEVLHSKFDQVWLTAKDVLISPPGAVALSCQILDTKLLAATAANERAISLPEDIAREFTVSCTDYLLIHAGRA